MTWNKDRKQTIYGHKRREHMTHTTEPWHNSPLPEGSSRSLTVPLGGWWGALEAPQDKHGQEHRTGTSRAETDRQWPWRSWELWRPWQMVFGGLGVGPLGPAPTAGTPSTPQKNFPGEVRGYQEPSGARNTEQYKTGTPPGPDRQDRTAHRNQKPSWLAWAELHLGMTRSQRPT